MSKTNLLRPENEVDIKLGERSELAESEWSERYQRSELGTESEGRSKEGCFMVRRWLYKRKLFPKGVVLEELRGIELVLKGEAQLVANLLKDFDAKREVPEQIGNRCLAALKGEIDINEGSIGFVDGLMPLDLGYRASNGDKVADGELCSPTASI